MRTFRVRLQQVRTGFTDLVGSALLFPLLWSLVHVRINRRSFRRSVSTLFIATGAILIFYVAAIYYTAYRTQHRLMRQWQQQTTSEEAASKGPALSRISIPKIDLDAVIVEGTNRTSLALGPGHLLSTALPGEAGNAVIAGHRDTFFRHLAELAPGDDIFIRRHRKDFHYVVFAKRIVDAADTSVLRTSSRSILTLITCFPITYIGPASRRLIIKARLAAASQPPDLKQRGRTITGSTL